MFRSTLSRRAVPFLLVAAALAASAVPAAAQTALTRSQFLKEYKANLAADGQGEYTRLTDPSVVALFELAVEDLMVGDLVDAQQQLDDLATFFNVHYELIEITDAPGPLAVLGLRETAAHGTAGFRGWGAVLVRPGGALDAVYQAPHPIDDQYTEKITLDAFLDDCCSALALFSGARRHSNGDGDGDGEDDSDAAHDTDSLFHALTEWAAGVAATDPAFYFQVHASIDRASEPTVVASDGASRPPWPPVTNGHPLVPVDDAVDAEGFVTMGVWGFDEGVGTEDGDYLRPGTQNAQGDFLETASQREQFVHLEIERTARVEYDAGSGNGFDGLHGLFRALRALLGPEIREAAYTAPATACRGEDIGSQVSLALENAGETAIGSYFHVGWYLSSDETWDASDRLLLGGRDQVFSMAPGQVVQVTVASNQVPTWATVGPQYLLVAVDEFDYVDERLENNNVLVRPIEIQDCTP
jgi:hypothetical protein